MSPAVQASVATSRDFFCRPRYSRVEPTALAAAARIPPQATSATSLVCGPTHVLSRHPHMQ